MTYHILMFSEEICSETGCNKAAVSCFDENGEIIRGKSYCLNHLKDKDTFLSQVRNYIQTHEKIIGLSCPGLHFADMDFSEKKFYGCNFQHCIFTNVHSENFRARISSFDYAIFADCNLIKSNLQFTSFAGATFSHILFTNSDLVHNNFCGIRAAQSSFDDSDLYNSRFIRATLLDTSFRNCNIKKTCFYEIEQQNCSFKLSNTREALLSTEVNEE